MKRKTTSRPAGPGAGPLRPQTAPQTTVDRIAALDPRGLDETERRSLLELALRLLAERHRRGRALQGPEDTRAYLRLGLAGYRNEVFGCLFLDNRHRVLGQEELFHGTVDGASVHPRVVVQRALELNAAAVVLYHNHPSGVAEPSRADELLTRRLRDALALIDVRVLDHLLVTAEESLSFAERGLL